MTTKKNGIIGLINRYFEWLQSIIPGGKAFSNTMKTLQDISPATGSKWDLNNVTSKPTDSINARAEAISSTLPSPGNKVATTAPKASGSIKTQEELTPEEMDEIMKAIAALEARIAKLEKALASGASPSQEREHIVAHKSVSQSTYYNHYFKTSKGRILEDIGSWHDNDKNYLETLKNALIGIGDEREIKADEPIETFLARIRAKYNPDQALPTLLGGYVLMPGGTIFSIRQSNKNIKF